jgi:hypothetical protein
MKESEQLSYFFADHANGRFAVSNKPAAGLKNRHNTAPNFATPLANNALPLAIASLQQMFKDYKTKNNDQDF